MNKNKAFCKHGIHLNIRCFQCEGEASQSACTDHFPEHSVCRDHFPEKPVPKVAIVGGGLHDPVNSLLLAMQSRGEIEIVTLSPEEIRD